MAQLKSNSRIYGNLRIDGRFLDRLNNPGTNGQILSSTGTATEWITPATGGGVTVQYFSAAGPATNLIINTEQTVVLNTTIATSGTGDFTIASGVVTIVNAGVYHISYSILTDILNTADNSRSESEAFLRINGTGELNHSQVIMYNREGIEGAATGAKTMLYSATANDTIEIVARLRAANSTNIRILQGQTVLTIYRVA